MSGNVTLWCASEKKSAEAANSYGVLSMHRLSRKLAAQRQSYSKKRKEEKAHQLFRNVHAV